jgi:hypothetical protein
MAEFEPYESLVTQLNELTHKLTAGKLNDAEMDRFVEVSRSLYERALIMRYKAMEAQVFGAEKLTDQEDFENEVPQEATEEQVQEPTNVEEDETKTGFDSGILFDFSNDIEVSLDEEKLQGEPLIIDTEIETPEVEEVETDSPVSHSTTQTVHADGTKVTSFYRRFEAVHNDVIANKLSNPKIDSIRSAFGLNDRLQIISELFSGDSETFSKTVEELDSTDSSQLALRKLSEIAVQYRWDAENKLVEEFVRVVDRKFV